jgi:hypothetical protein
MVSVCRLKSQSADKLVLGPARTVAADWWRFIQRGAPQETEIWTDDNVTIYLFNSAGAATILMVPGSVSFSLFKCGAFQTVTTLEYANDELKGRQEVAALTSQKGFRNSLCRIRNSMVSEKIVHQMASLIMRLVETSNTTDHP